MNVCIVVTNIIAVLTLVIVDTEDYGSTEDTCDDVHTGKAQYWPLKHPSPVLVVGQDHQGVGQDGQDPTQGQHRQQGEQYQHWHTIIIIILHDCIVVSISIIISTDEFV